MSTDNTPSPASMADLLESAVALSDLNRAKNRAKDPENYRHPLSHLSDWQFGQVGSVSVGGTIEWNPALRAAYQDGYDPLLWIGRGASCDVWRCVDRSFGREVALKIPCLEPGQDVGSVVDALQEEAELLGKLHHPGIVHAVRRAGDGRAAYLALDFVDGEDLLEHCRLMKLDVRACLRLYEKVLHAVAYLHGKGVVHGDLKPEHIIVREDDQPVLIDFGLSAYDSVASFRLQDSRRVGGSGIYRAPEITNATASSSEPQHDVYAMGVILCELLRDTPLEDLADGVNYIVARATEEELADRWPDANAMLDALRSVLSFLPPSAGPGLIATGHDVAKPRNRPGVLLSMAMVLLIAAMVGVVWALLPDRMSDTDQSPILSIDSSQSVVIQASVFDIALGDLYAGNIEAARSQIDQLANDDDTRAAEWEVAHLQAMADGSGEQFPLGQDPYDAPHAACLDYAPESQTVAYVKRGQGLNQLWVRPFDGPAVLIFQSRRLIRAVAISPGADRLATVDEDGRVTIRELKDAQVINTVELPRLLDDRVIWFGPKGKSLFTFSPKARSVEGWQMETPLAGAPAWVLEECDHAYPLPSGKGYFLVATAGANTKNQQTLLRLISPEGEIKRQLDLRDGQVPASADTQPNEQATVCLGMPNGFVRIYDSKRGGWQPTCDLGRNAAIPAVVYSEKHQRAFAALGRVHVIDHTGQLKMRLGDRNKPQQLITELHFDETSASLTSLSLQEVWRCGVK